MDNDSGVDETTQAKIESSPKKPVNVSLRKQKQPLTSPTKKLSSPTKPITSPVKTMATARGSTTGIPTAKAAPASVDKTQGRRSTSKPEGRELPMNKVVVGLTPSPNLREVKSRIGSLDNIKHRPGGGKVKLETKKVDFSQAKSKVGSTDNITHKPGGGERKIMSKKLDWKAESKVGSMDNATHKPGGGNKKIETVKLDFKDKAKPKVGSKDNIKHTPTGGAVIIEQQKLDFKDKAKSKVGSLDNVNHKPGGGTVKIFDEKILKPRSSSKVGSAANSDGQASDVQSPAARSPLSALSPAPPLEECPEEVTSQETRKLLTEAAGRMAEAAEQ